MNKLLLSVAALALVSSPAFAAEDSGVKLKLGGHMKGYVNYSDEDSSTRSVDILRQTEVHFGGETTLDNGLTVGAHIEAATDVGDGFAVDESYAYFAGSWGRVNFGSEDGAAYLLQVAAPSADDNIDGIRQFINPSATIDPLDYANDINGDSDKITYLSPVFSGFQAGLSYTPESVDFASALTGVTGDSSRSTGGNALDNEANDFGDVWELGVRYEGQVSNVGVIAGAGYTHASIEAETVPALTDNFQEWNVGLDLDIGAFGLGVIYTENNYGLESSEDSETWVLGADYTTGPFKVGASYLNNDLLDLVDTDRYTVGVGYTYGPGMSFRGSLGYTDFNDDTGLVGDQDATTLTVGTQINF